MHCKPSGSRSAMAPVTAVCSCCASRFRVVRVSAFCKSSVSPSVVMPTAALCGSWLGSSSLSLGGSSAHRSRSFIPGMTSRRRLRDDIPQTSHGTQPCVEDACNLEPNSMVCVPFVPFVPQRCLFTSHGANGLRECTRHMLTTRLPDHYILLLAAHSSTLQPKICRLLRISRRLD